MVDGVPREASYARLLSTQIVAPDEENAPRPKSRSSSDVAPPRQSVWSVQVNVTETLPNETEIDDVDKEYYDNHDVGSGNYVAACRHYVKLTLEGPKNGPYASCIQCAIIFCILFSTCCVIAETMQDVDREFRHTFIWLENAFTFVFTVEILVRVWVADNPCEYLLTAANLVDMLAVMPWYIEFLACRLILAAQNHFDEQVSDSFESLRMVRIVRMIRLARVARLAKAARHSETITTMIQSVKSSASGLNALVACICMGTVFSATAIYWLECEEPETEFTSIPASIWWALPTITGVGYGDMVPMTVPGRIAASLSMVAGTLITSLCVAILTNSFIEQFNRNQQKLRFQQAKANSFRVDKKKKKLKAATSSTFDEFVTSSHQLDAPLQRMDFESEIEHSVDRENLMEHLHALEDEVSNLMMHLQSRDKNKDSTYKTSMEILEEHRKMFFKHLGLAVEQVVEEEEVMEAEAASLMRRNSSMMIEKVGSEL